MVVFSRWKFLGILMIGNGENWPEIIVWGHYYKVGAKKDAPSPAPPFDTNTTRPSLPAVASRCFWVVLRGSKVHPSSIGIQTITSAVTTKNDLVVLKCSLQQSDGKRKTDHLSIDRERRSVRSGIRTLPHCLARLQ